VLLCILWLRLNLHLLLRLVLLIKKLRLRLLVRHILSSLLLLKTK
jgi:hypothetical protein